MTAALIRAIAGLLGSAAGVLWLLCAYTVARSGFASNPATDPHGYAVMFGTVVGTIAGLLFALVLPTAFPKPRRRRVSRACWSVFIATMVALYAALSLL